MKQNYQETNKDIQLDNYFREGLQNIQPEYQEELWQNLETQLDNIDLPQISEEDIDGFVHQKLSNITPTYQENAWNKLEKELDIVEKANLENDKAFDNLVKSELLSINPSYQENVWNELERQLNNIDNPDNPEDAEFDNLVKSELLAVEPFFQEGAWNELEKKLSAVEKPSQKPVFQLRNWQKIAAVLILSILGAMTVFVTQNSFNKQEDLSTQNKNTEIKQEHKEFENNQKDNIDNNNQSLATNEDKSTIEDKENLEEPKYVSNNSGSGNNISKQNTGSIHTFPSQNKIANSLLNTDVDNTNNNIHINKNLHNSLNTFSDYNIKNLKAILLEEQNNIITNLDLIDDSLLPTSKPYKNIQYFIGAGFGNQTNMSKMAENLNNALSYGITNEIRYKNKFALSLGAFYSFIDFSYQNGFQEPVTSNVDNFIDEIEYIPEAQIFQEINVASDILEIPLELKYFINNNSKYKVFTSIGTSSYVFLRQQFTYNLDFTNQLWAEGYQHTAVVKDVSKGIGAYPFSHFNLSLGIESQIHKNYSLILQPHYIFAMKKIGLEQIYQDTLGLRILILFKS